MKQIKDYKNWPKFIVVNELPEKQTGNKFLLMPWKKGEVVKVAPVEEQVPNRKYDNMFMFVKPITDNQFRERFVKVIRKDVTGKWSLIYTESWANFNTLNNIKK